MFTVSPHICSWAVPVKSGCAASCVRAAADGASACYLAAVYPQLPMPHSLKPCHQLCARAHCMFKGATWLARLQCTPGRCTQLFRHRCCQCIRRLSRMAASLQVHGWHMLSPPVHAMAALGALVAGCSAGCSTTCCQTTCTMAADLESCEPLRGVPLRGCVLACEAAGPDMPAGACAVCAASISCCGANRQPQRLPGTAVMVRVPVSSRSPQQFMPWGRVGQG